jgi:hypothetical protein
MGSDFHLGEEFSSRYVPGDELSSSPNLNEMVQGPCAHLVKQILREKRCK